MIPICVAGPEPGDIGEVAHNGGSGRGYLVVGGASQQSRYGLLNGRLFCIYNGASPQPDEACACGRGMCAGRLRWLRISCHTRPKLTRSSTSLQGKLTYTSPPLGRMSASAAIRDVRGLLDTSVRAGKKRLRGSLPSPALPGSGPWGRRSASQLSGLSAFPSRLRLPGGWCGPAPSITSQTTVRLHGVEDGRLGPKALACTGRNVLAPANSA
jgi:hypothetical protein